MTSEEIKTICQERLGSWQERLVESHATPAVLLGVGHDQHSGDIVICTVEEMSNENIILFLQDALTKLVEQTGR
jgi:hypothetical protein